MKNILIYSRQNPLHRLFDIGITLLAWGLFGGLILQGISRLLDNQAQGLSLNKILFYLAVALFVNIALLVWAKYNQRRFRTERRHRQPGLDVRDVARSLHIPLSKMEILSQSRVVVVHHCHDGFIRAVSALI